MNTIIEIVTTSVLNTIRDIGFIFVPLLSFGLLLYLLSRWTRACLRNSGLEKVDSYITGMIGVPVHEIGHLIFCIPFGHTITSASFFNPKTFELGSIEHQYNPNNPYHLIGNFFISIGPLLLGSTLLWVLTLTFFDTSFNDFVPSVIDLSSIQNACNSLYSALFTATHHLISLFQFREPSTWLFIYLSISISSHMELSPPDIKGMFSGFLAISITLLVLNSIGAAAGFSQNVSALFFQKTVAPLTLFFCYALALSLLSFIGVYTITALMHLLRTQRILNPFS
ncbi:MAG: hypothetical protein OCD01_12315 [Fibrobacterales bacterium]